MTDKRQANFIPLVAKLSYNRRRNEGYLGNVGLYLSGNLLSWFGEGRWSGIRLNETGETRHEHGI